MNDRSQLGDFLRRRRDAISPALLGVVVGGRRRAAGLRREEVAELANISTAYYERLEQGRGPEPSSTVLAGIADALQLTTDERDHLYQLVGRVPPAGTTRNGHLDSGLSYVLHAVDGSTPACMTDDLGEVVAQNRLNAALFGPSVGLPGRESNLVWRWFTSQKWRDLLEPPEQHEATALVYVADLRASVARRGNDSAAEELVEELLSTSAEFGVMWDQHVVSSLYCLPKVVHDERVGRLDLECSVLVSAVSGQRLLLLHPVAGTPTARRLARLSTYI